MSNALPDCGHAHETQLCNTLRAACTMTRKRKFTDATDSAPRKRRAPTVNIQESSRKHSNVHLPLSHEVLSLYYPCIVSLRQFLISSLPLSSTACRRRVSTYGSDRQAGTPRPHLFDSALVAVFPEAQVTIKEARRREYLAFTQSQQRSTASGSTQNSRFAEVCNFVRQRSSNRFLALHIGSGTTDKLRLWNMLYGRCFKKPNPPHRDRSTYFVMDSTESQNTVHQTIWNLMPVSYPALSVGVPTKTSDS